MKKTLVGNKIDPLGQALYACLKTLVVGVIGLAPTTQLKIYRFSKRPIVKV
jgi:hypothetical protein